MNILTIFLIAVFSALAYGPALANDYHKLSKEEKKFRRFMEWANPTPYGSKQSSDNLPYLLNEPELESFVFINSSTTHDGGDLNPMQNESSIAVNPTNPLNLIASAVDYRNNNSAFVYVSHDGGKSWENILLPGTFPGWTAGNDPSVAFNVDGVGYMCYGSFNTTTRENGVFIARSADEGRNWEAPLTVIAHTGEQTPDSVFEDKYYIEIDDVPTSPYFNHMYIPWKRVTDLDSATQIVMAKSTDGGDTWLEPVAVSDRVTGISEDTTFGQSFPICTTGPNGEVYCAWNYGPLSSVGFAVSLDGGQTFSEPRLIHTYEPFGVTRELSEGVFRHSLKGGVRAEAYPTIECDITDGPRKGWIYLCWAAGRVPDIFFSRSTDNGATWSEAIVVSEDPTNDQFWPWLSLDPMSGELAVMYLDSRDDEANMLTNCYVAYSNDGGDTWIDKRASDVSSDLRRNPFGSDLVQGTFAGDYSGNAFFDGIIYPSWFDTRNVRANNRDSDVFTAIMNTRSPRPPTNLRVDLIAERPTELELSWSPPTERVFGQPLGAAEFNYALFRDGEFVTDIPGNASEYIDTGLEPFEKYEYELYAFADDDTSLVCIASQYAGGAREPDVAELGSILGGGDNNVRFTVTLPTLRADKTTPLVNLAFVNIYRDGELIEARAVAPTDTGRTIEINDNPGERGFYRYAVTAVDASDPPNESALSNELIAYTGIVESTFEEPFDVGPIPRYFNSGDWELTNAHNRSEPNAFTESADGNYRGGEDTLIIFPVTNNVDTRYELRFWNTAILHNSDSAYVEISTDGMNTWRQLAVFDNQAHEPWSDGILDQNDWRLESLPFTNDANDTSFIRFRFFASVALHSDGWYIDDVRITMVTSVREAAINAQRPELYPNPTSSRLTLLSRNETAFLGARFSVFDAFGRRLEHAGRLIENAGNSVVLDVGALHPGVYSLQWTAASGAQDSYLFIVSR